MLRTFSCCLMAVGCGTSAELVVSAADGGSADAREAPDPDAAAPEASVRHDAAPPDSEARDGPAYAASFDASGLSAEDASVPELPAIGPRCFSEIWDPAARGPDYDQFHPTPGSHCFGTNHQTIDGVERVVFLGDSVTVGTPPTPHASYYRSVLADLLAERFALEPPNESWKRASLLDGRALVQSSGDFTSCAKWGARTDDLLRDNSQIMDCVPEADRTRRTLFVMTIGGNDIASITKMGPSGVPLPEIRAKTEEFVGLLSEAVSWMKSPSNFPNGSFVVFGNMFEFTDATGDVGSCPAASVAGFDAPWSNPADLEELVIWANEQYMRIAVDTGSDLVWMLEHFCGHGYHHDDPNNRCYRGPTAERWFDVSCIHPNPTGHARLAEMFMSVVSE
ncbi:MAG: SGNH/GDSL hydrolase family protein [Deltaproteobacteria bacterium]|nr:SGNH/GDSL hydrolase family protein [Deltaproteobacteria bacterium]